MNPIRHLVLITAILAGLSLTAACSPTTPKSIDWNQENVSESRWSAIYTSCGESTPLTLILMTGEKHGRSRLVILSAFSATLGDCMVASGRGQCSGPRGAEGLTNKISGAIGVMLQHDAAFLTEPGQGPAKIGQPGWQATRNAAGVIEYRLVTPSSWTLTMKKATK